MGREKKCRGTFDVSLSRLKHKDINHEKLGKKEKKVVTPLSVSWVNPSHFFLCSSDGDVVTVSSRIFLAVPKLYVFFKGVFAVFFFFR